MTESAKVVAAMMNVMNTSSGVSRILIDRLLHLAQQVIDLHQVLVGSRVRWHR